MRQSANARVITVKKNELINKIKENKANHIKEYEEAVAAYRAEAKKQLEAQLKALESGSLKIRVELVTPVNKAEEYDKLLTMFEWEVNDFVELSQGEFNEYVLDETSFALQARLLNSTYSGR